MPRAIRFYHFVFSWQFTPLKGMQVHHWAVRTGNSGPGIDGGLLCRLTRLDGAAVTVFVATIAVADLGQYVMKATTSGGQLSMPKMSIRGIGWLAYCKDTEDILFGRLEASTGMK